jgi:hypothetical protein
MCGGTTPRCQNGTCVADCTAAGLTACNNACINQDTDPMNCGGCNQRCASGEVCVAGNCQSFRATACTTCPCDVCGGGHPTCCMYPGAPSEVICVDTGGGMTCP